MRDLIGGKRYDTETAKLIAAWPNGPDQEDFYFCEERLYRTRSGDWFIAGWGNGGTAYGEPFSDGSLGPSAAIIPLTSEEARKWLHEYERMVALNERIKRIMERA